eukprot:gene9854-20494_t
MTESGGISSGSAVKRRVAYFYDQEIGNYHYGQGHPMKGPNDSQSCRELWTVQKDGCFPPKACFCSPTYPFPLRRLYKFLKSYQPR